MDSPNPPKNIALAADMRMGAMFEAIYDAIEELKQMDVELDIIFLDASDNALVSRFTQTRRKHPLSGSGNVLSGIFAERERLQLSLIHIWIHTLQCAVKAGVQSIIRCFTLLKITDA